MLKQIADAVVVIDVPQSFEAVGEYYQDFRQVRDEEVKVIMHKHVYKTVVRMPNLLQSDKDRTQKLIKVMDQQALTKDPFLNA